MKKLGILSILLASFMFLTISVNAQDENANKNPIPNQTEQQKKDIRKIRKEYKSVAKPLRAVIKELHTIHDELMRKESADMKAIEDNIRKASAKKVELAILTAKMHQDTRALLDKDQRDWYDKNRMDRKKKREGKRN